MYSIQIRHEPRSLEWKWNLSPRHQTPRSIKCGGSSRLIYSGTGGSGSRKMTAAWHRAREGRDDGLDGRKGQGIQALILGPQSLSQSHSPIVMDFGAAEVASASIRVTVMFRSCFMFALPADNVPISDFTGYCLEVKQILCRILSMSKSVSQRMILHILPGVPSRGACCGQIS